MSPITLTQVWSPADFAEVLTATQVAPQCPATLTMYGEQFPCDNTEPHTMHTSAALRARWVDAAVR